MLAVSTTILIFFKTPFVLDINAMALLVFLSRAARTLFVTSNFWLVSHHCLYLACFLTRSGRPLIWTSKCQLRRTSWPSSNSQSFRWFFGYDVQVEERTY